MLFRAPVIGSQDMNLRVFSQTLYGITVFCVKVAQIIEGKLWRGPTPIGAYWPSLLPFALLRLFRRLYASMLFGIKVLWVAFQVVVIWLWGKGRGFAARAWAESILPFMKDNFFDSGIARHHFLFDFIVAKGESLEEGGGICQFVEHILHKKAAPTRSDAGRRPAVPIRAPWTHCDLHFRWSHVLLDGRSDPPMPLSSDNLLLTTRIHS